MISDLTDDLSGFKGILASQKSEPLKIVWQM